MQRPESNREGHLAALGLPPGAAPEEVRAAYRKLALRLHPDKPGGDIEKFKAVQGAYDALTKPEEPESGPFGAGGPFGMHFDIGNLFGFGCGGRATASGAHSGPVATEELMANIELRQLTVPGEPVRVTLQHTRRKACAGCAGRGWAAGSEAPACAACGGEGRRAAAAFPGIHINVRCEACGGAGKARPDPATPQPANAAYCKTCGGACVERVEEGVDLRLELPAGVPDGARVVVRGQGSFNPDAGVAGDIGVTVRYVVPAGVTLLGGGDVRVEVPLSTTEALFGFCKRVAPCGTPVTVRAAGPADFDREECLQGMGIFRGQASGCRGKLLIKLRVRAPDKNEVAMLRSLMRHSEAGPPLAAESEAASSTPQHLDVDFAAATL